MTTKSDTLRELWLEDGGTPSLFEMLSDEVVIGREAAADLTLDNHRVSRRHARIFREEGHLRFEDLGSSNGTALNGLPVLDVVTLRTGDVIEIGPFRIHVGRRPAEAVEAEPDALAPTAAPPAEAPRRGTPAARAPAARAPALPGFVVPMLALAGVAFLAIVFWPVITSALFGDGRAGGDAGAGRKLEGTAKTDAPDWSGTFEDAVAQGRVAEARSAFEKLGRPADLQSRLDAMLELAAARAVGEAQHLREARGPEAALAYLRAQLAEFPQGSRARRDITSAILSMPSKGSPASARSELAAPEREGAAAGGEEAPPDAEVAKGPDAAPSAEKDDLDLVRPPVPPRREPPKREPVALDPVVLAQIASAEKALHDRNFDGAEATLQPLVADLRAGAEAGGAKHAEALRRAERVLRATEHSRRFVDALVAAFTANPAAFSRIPAGSGDVGKVVTADREGLTIETLRGPEHLVWRIVSTSTLKALVKKAGFEGPALVDAAVVLRLANAKEESLAALAAAYRRSMDLKPVIDQELADARQLATVPDEGFTLEGDEWLSPQERARRELSRSIEADCKRLASEKPEERALAFEALHALGDAARSQTHRALLLARIALVEKVQKVPGATALAQIDTLREDLDRERAGMLALVFDEKLYPYPYRAPEAPPEAYAIYQRTQAEVNERLAKVRALWKDPRNPKIPPVVREFASQLREIDGWITKNGFGEAPPAIRWLAHLPSENQLSIRNIAIDAKDRERIDESVKTMERGIL